MGLIVASPLFYAADGKRSFSIKFHLAPQQFNEYFIKQAAGYAILTGIAKEVIITEMLKKAFIIDITGVDKWVSETLLYQIVSRIVHPDCVLRHFRPEWLGGLELDIYIPDRRFAVEYQGQQHFHPIEVWGGEEALEALQARDAKKAKACKQHGVCLITFDYEESLTEDYIRKVLVESLEDRT